MGLGGIVFGESFDQRVVAATGEWIINIKVLLEKWLEIGRE